MPSSVKVNLDTDRLRSDERESRKYFTSLKPTTYVPSDGILPVYCADKIRFKLKQPEWDARGAIDGFFVEEDMRRRFFYPYLPCNFIDVGVTHGSWTLPAIASGANVFGFEIDPRYYPSLKGSLDINKDLKGNLRLMSIGLLDENGIGELFELENIRFAPLDDLMKFIGFAPQYIKIDVEGLENKVLEGARKTIDLLRPHLFIEVHYLSDDNVVQKREKDKNVCDFLKKYDYVYERGRVQDSFCYLFFTQKKEDPPKPLPSS